MADLSGVSPSSSPTTKAPSWLSHGRQINVLYPLFCVLIVVLILLLYCYIRRSIRKKRSTSRHVNETTDTAPSSDDESPAAGMDTAGLNPRALSSLPGFVYAVADEERAPECAVCLGEAKNGDRGRLLPRCGHKFHADCVDMWFRSHSTCPVCRSAAAVEPAGAVGSDDAV
ncbi:RING-H2 finger protein ATL17-like [Canna indica]|uniref:RING-H2 finger protein ATL17-like n=1 Tax=Canna indica TaxID=4628 RepID=A0AAQ3Q7C5_9LILI|nr:RING-H2 finger protein ATL17-like [Canna indica]